MNQRRVYRIQAGSINNLRSITEPIEPPGQDEVQIAIHYIGLNFADLYSIWGMYKAAPKSDFVPGLEYSGTIESVGQGVTEWKPGEEVMGVTRFGAYTDTINIDARYVTRLPSGWSLEQGAAFLVQAITAYYGMVELGQLEKGKTVLIHSAAGGVGIQANRIAKRMGAFTIGSVGSENKIELLKQEGYDRWIVRSNNFKQDLGKSLGDRNLNIIMECIGGSILKAGFQTLAPEGRMIVYGNASFTTHGNRPNKLKMLIRFLKRPKIDPLRLPNSNKSVMGFNLIWLYHQADKFKQVVDDLIEMGLPAPHVGATFDYDHLQDAVRTLQRGKTTGKVVVRVMNDE